MGVERGGSCGVVWRVAGVWERRAERLSSNRNGKEAFRADKVSKRLVLVVT